MSCYTIGDPSQYKSLPRRTSSWYSTVFNTNVSIEAIIVSKQLANKYKVLQYVNSGHLTKQQKYTQMVKGTWTNRTTTWATQNANGYTNPNTQKLMRSTNSYNIAISRTTGAVLGPTTLPVTCPITPIDDYPVLPINDNNNNNNNNDNTDDPNAPPEPPPPPPPPPPDPTNPSDGNNNEDNPFFPPIVIPSPPIGPIVVPNNGSLLCHTFKDFCNK